MCLLGSSALHLDDAAVGIPSQRVGGQESPSGCVLCGCGRMTPRSELTIKLLEVLLFACMAMAGCDKALSSFLRKWNTPCVRTWRYAVYSIVVLPFISLGEGLR